MKKLSNNIKRYTLLLVAIFYAILYDSAVMAGNVNGQEIGDVVFRRIHFLAPWEKHSAIYCEYTNGDPDKDSNHYVIEEKGPASSDGVRQISFEEFQSYGDYFGSMGNGYISKDKRDAIKETATRLKNEGLSYTNWWPSTCVWWEDGFLGNPADGKLQRDEIHGLRSDAFVEYVYALNGNIIAHDIINEPSWFNRTILGYTIFTPTDQYNSMHSATIDQPKIADDLTSLSHKDAIGKWNDPQSKKPKIDVQWKSENDDDVFSGLHSYYIKWDRLPNNWPNYYYCDKIFSAYSGNHTYNESKTLAQGTDDGKWYLHIRSVDKAGNWDVSKSLTHLGPIYIDTVLPFAVTDLKSTHEVNKWYNKEKANITTTWKAAEDDTSYVDNPADVSGIGGYGVLWNTSATSLPPEQKTIEAVTSTTSGALPDGKQYFHIRSVDKAGNWDDAAVHIGPFWIDITSPNIAISIVKEIPGATLPGGKKWIKARIFRVTVTDPIVNDARSGLKEVFINGAAQALTQGQASWSGETYVETPAWIKVV